MVSKSQERVEILLKASLNSDQSISNEIQSIPCKIEYTGPANIADFFHRETIDQDGEEAATLRGYLLNGTKFQLPAGYKLCVAKEQRNFGGEKRVFNINDKTDHFTIWEYDRRPSLKNPKQKALNFLKIAQELSDD